MNYDLKMKEQIEKTPIGSSLLLHVCCAPCSSAVLERLGEFFKITLFFYNPNITEKEEYDKRLKEIKKFITTFPTKYPIDIMEGDYHPDVFFEMTKGLEDCKERGPRCYKCYEMRLKETARIAEENSFDYFTTTLSLSPYKNSDWINEIGENILSKSLFLYADFKKNNGYKRSIELSKEYNLYRQDYCGCIYSKR